MFKKEDFDKYYKAFLGSDLKKIYPWYIVKAQEDNRILNNHYYYPLILTHYEGKNFLSITPEFYSEFKNELSSMKPLNINDFIKTFFESRLNGFEYKKMLRLTKYDNIPLHSTMAIPLTHNAKTLFMNSGKNKDVSFKEKKWELLKPYISEKRHYIVPSATEILSIAHISDIQEGAGNIVVFTPQAHRQKGYGKEAVTGTLEWCMNNKVLPIYFVDERNIASINLAKSLGFVVETHETVVCYQK